MMTLDEAELKTMADREQVTLLEPMSESEQAISDAQTIDIDFNPTTRCSECDIAICPDDDLCADCERQAKDSEAWKEYCWNEWKVKI